MTIQRIGGTSVALYLTPDDLEARGLTTEALDMERALALTEDAFQQAGIAIGGTLEIEAFPNSSGVLVLARICAPDVSFFQFADIEAVICAAQVLPEAAGTLYRTADGYVVAISGERESHILSEFGVQLKRMSGYEAWLREHAQTLIAAKALSCLARGFA